VRSCLPTWRGRHVRSEYGKWRGEVTMAVRSGRRRAAQEHDFWRVVDYGLFSVIVAFFGVVLFMMLLGVTHGWSANP
jgi:hypothetical protein